MKDKLIVDERMKEFSRDVLHWINYDYVIINDDLDDCYRKIDNLIQAEITTLTVRSRKVLSLPWGTGGLRCTAMCV